MLKETKFNSLIIYTQHTFHFIIIFYQNISHILFETKT